MKKETRAVILRNLNCIYCDAELELKNETNTPLASNKEHVIGRNFVPKGSFKNNEWNLIARCCVPCNNTKSDLEDDISAITMLQTTIPEDNLDEKLAAAFRKKSVNSISQATGKPVAASEQRLRIKGEFGNANLTFTFTAPPQASEHRIFKLAMMQTRAFFFYLRYDEKKRRGLPEPGKFYGVCIARKTDWGNATITAFAEHVLDWEPVLILDTAQNYYRTLIKQSSDSYCWSIAMEWNKTHRIASLVGSEDACKAVMDALPKPKAHQVAGNKTDGLAIRKEISLSGTDRLFEFHE